MTISQKMSLRRGLGPKLLFAAICVAGYAALPAAQGCQSCTPAAIGYVKPQSHSGYTVCVATYGDANIGLSSTESEGIGNGIMQYWNGFFQSHDIPVSFDVVYENDASNCASGTIVVAPDTTVPSGDMGLATVTEDPQDGYIGINPSEMGDKWGENNWKNLGAHEFGHLLGLDNVNNSACQPYSIMATPQSR